MTTVTEYLIKFEEHGNKLIGYSIINSIINIMEEAACELSDDVLSIKLEELREHVMDQHNKILQVEIDD